MSADMSADLGIPEPLETLFDAASAADQSLPLPPELTRRYGTLRFPARTAAPYVLGNFVTTLDGVVALDEPGYGGGGEISGFNIADRMVMGLLRASADAVVVGAGTLRADAAHIWTAEHIFPPLAASYAALRAALGKAGPPLNVIVSAGGRLDTSLPVFQSGAVPVLIVTTPAGAQQLATRRLPPSVTVTAAPSDGAISAGMVLDAIAGQRECERVLVEGGPHLMGDFFAEQRLDELFLTLAPQVVGRGDDAARPGFVAGKRLAPEHAVWGALRGVKRSGSHLFLRYAMPTTTAVAGTRPIIM